MKYNTTLPSMEECKDTVIATMGTVAGQWIMAGGIDVGLYIPIAVADNEDGSPMSGDHPCRLYGAGQNRKEIFSLYHGVCGL